VVENLGEDTDTTGAITGAMVGLMYGYNNIPKEWRENILKINEIEDLVNRFYRIVS